jgi:DNA-binding transcriptional LysR family regulator
MNVYNVFNELFSCIRSGINMTLTKFEIFRTVVEAGSLTKAAETLNLTQSGVSHAIASLESDMGFSLLTRDRSGISLTDNGERILKYIREILHWDELLKQETAAINGIEAGTVRIGTFTSVSTLWLPGIIKQFHNIHPSIDIKLLEGNYADIDQWISNGSVDFGFVSLPTSSPFDIIPLKKDRMLCILPREHPLCKLQRVCLKEIVDEPFIMPKVGCDNDVSRIFKEQGITPNIKFEVADDHAIIAMVQNGIGISILPEMILFNKPDNIYTLELEGENYRSIGIATVCFTKISPAARRFINCVKTWLCET